MAIEGKKKYQIYLTEKDVEFLRKYLNGRPNTGGLSGFLDKHIRRSVWMIKNNQDIFDRLTPGKMTFKKMIELTKFNIRMQEEYENCDTESKK